MTIRYHGLIRTCESACRALRQRQSRFPVLFLSTGGTCWHADERRMSIQAAVAFALEANLQGLVLDSGAVQQQTQAVMLARSKGLKVRTAHAQHWTESGPRPVVASSKKALAMVC
jgi:glycerophosphoryl diester phosphodiesterase